MKSFGYRFWMTYAAIGLLLAINGFLFGNPVSDGTIWCAGFTIYWIREIFLMIAERRWDKFTYELNKV